MNKSLKGIFASDMTVPYWMLIPGIARYRLHEYYPKFAGCDHGISRKRVVGMAQKLRKVVAATLFGNR